MSNFIEQAITHKSQGRIEESVQLLKYISQVGVISDQHVAKYELALLNSQLGQHDLADRDLTDLGYRYKLSPELLCSSTSRIEIEPPAIPNKFVNCFENAIPLHLFSQICRFFSKDSLFWQEHRYPNDKFFSYNVPLRSHGSFSLIEELASCLRPLVVKSFGLEDSDIDSIEWWCHKRDDVPTGGAHQMHFDLDEALLSELQNNPTQKEKGSKKKNLPLKHVNLYREEVPSNLHPLVSTVIYLTGCEDPQSLSPTLVTDQTLSPCSQATQGWLSYPRPNRVLFFDGRLLHGVLPTLNIHTPPSPAPPCPRITLMIGWWRKGVRVAPLPSSVPHPAQDLVLSLRPNMLLPSPITITHKKQRAPLRRAFKCQYSGQTVHWPSQLYAPSSRTQPTTPIPPPSLCPLHFIRGPIYVPISPDLPALPPLPAASSAESTPKTPSSDSAPIVPSSSQTKRKYQKLSSSLSPSSPLSSSSSSVVSFISLSDLKQLRGQAQEEEQRTKKRCELASDNESDEHLQGDEVQFFGRWFLKSLSEIREEVLGVK